MDLGLGRIANIERLRRTFWSRLKGSFDLGFSHTSADAKTEFSAKAKWTLSGDTMVRRQPAIDNIERDNVTAIYQRFFSGKWLALGMVGAQRNLELALDLRLLGTAAAGYHIVHTVQQDLAVLAGLNVISEQFTDARDDKESLEAVIAARYDLYALGGRDFTVTADVSAYPSLTVKDRLRFEANLDLRREIFEDFYFSVRFFDSLDNSIDPDSGRQNDYGITTSLGYSF